MKRILLSLLLVFIYACAQAQISVSPIIVDTGSKQVQKELKRSNSVNVKVNNLSNQRAFVTAIPVLERAADFAKQDDKITPMSNAQSKKYGFLVSPRKFIIPAKGSQVVKFIFTPTSMNKKADSIYRVYIEDVDNRKLKSSGTGVMLNIRYGVLVINRPKDASAKIEASCENNRLSLRNSGNTNALVSNFEFCDAKNQCQKQEHNKRLYANESWTLNADNAKSIRYINYSANQQTDHSINCQ